VPKIDIQQLTKLYYSIGELAQLLDVNTSLLRFWEKEFNLEVSKKNNKGNRLFSVKEIETINRIYELVKIEGYTLEGAKKSLKSKKSVSSKEISAQSIENVPSESNNRTEVIQHLLAIRERLLRLKNG
jgi:DNA-binding transcriptional MerR regulator